MPIPVDKHGLRSARQQDLSDSTKNLIIATLSMVILFACATSVAGIYKWTDAQGNVHYGSEKPVEAAAEKMQVDTRLTGTRPGTEALDKIKQQADDEAEKIKAEGTPEQPPVPSLPKKEVKQRCNTAKQNLATIQSRGQLRERDEQGNTRYVGEEERQQRIKQAKKRIREYCN